MKHYDSCEERRKIESEQNKAVQDFIRVVEELAEEKKIAILTESDDYKVWTLQFVHKDALPLYKAHITDSAAKVL